MSPSCHTLLSTCRMNGLSALEYIKKFFRVQDYSDFVISPKFSTFVQQYKNNMETTVLNPAQLRILHMMSYIKTDEELYGLEQVLSRYFAQKVDLQMDMLCKNGEITLETIESWGKEHMRTLYK